MGIGQLTVDVPNNAIVTVDAHVGIGQADAFGQSGSDVQVQWSPPGIGGGDATPRLTVHAHVGIGDIQVVRG